MEDISITFFRDHDIEGNILIEGLPGIGQVGKLVAEYMIEELGAEKIADVHSIYFPPQVIMNEDGTVRLPNNEIYRYKGEKDLLFLVGDFQSTSPEGHYLLTDAYLDIAEELGVTRIYTLGGYGVGHLVDHIRVLGAVNKDSLRTEVEDAGAIFTQSEPGGGIIGASGLLLGMGGLRGIDGICLMGETSGYLVDPRSAQCLLEVLCRTLNLEVDATKLADRAHEMERLVERLKEIDQAKTDEELTYIG
jgi:uncharacterized protein (TIGR00162 family)